MKLNYTKRAAEKKSQSKSLRREGKVPAVLYVRGKASEPVTADLAEFQSHLRQVKPGHLPTTIFSLVGEDGKERKSIVKEIQYHPTTYDILHLDFEELVDDVHVNIKVPIECTGVVDCVGIKLGGVLRQVIRHVKVRCLPKDIPSSFELDIRSLNMSDSKRLSDIEIPANVRSLANLREVAVVIVKR